LNVWRTSKTGLARPPPSVRFSVRWIEVSSVTAKFAAAGFVLAALAGGFLAFRPIFSGLIALTCLVAFICTRIGVWRSAYGLTVALMLGATSSQPLVATVSYYPRFVALAVVAVLTYQTQCDSPHSFKEMSRPARMLTLGLAAAAATAVCSTLWSVDPLLTIQQAAALSVLAATVHALVSRRWTDRGLIPGDLGTAYWVLVAFFALGFVAHAAGLPGTESAAGFDGVNFVDLRYQGLANNPNMLAVLAVPAVPLGWYLYQQKRRRLFLVGLLPVVASLLMSQSRTALLAVVGAVLIVVLRRGSGALTKLCITVGVLIGLSFLSGITRALLASTLVAEITGRFESHAGGGVLNGRSQAWTETAEILGARPGTGYGYAAGPSLFEQLRASGDLAFGRDVVHNSYLQWLLETGLIGAPALLMMVAACALAAWVAGGKVATSGLAWCLFAGLIMQFAESAMLGTGQAYPFVFWIVAAGAAVTATPAVTPTPVPALAR
jgi:exopolysaccharide production protein ExoQ